MNHFMRLRKTPHHYSLWFRDFRPTSLTEVAGNKDLVESLKIYVRTNVMPNLLLSGPNGTAKRTMAKLTAQEYLGDYYSKACIQIDGSINRGKDTVTNTNDYKKNSITGDHVNIINFVKRLIRMDGKKRIVIINNFDHMTAEAQNAMRRIIEIYAKTTRFFLICNGMENIIDAIQSRCTPLRTTSLSDTELKPLLEHILTKAAEKQPSVVPNRLDSDLLDTICLLSGGDIKKAINYLQMIAYTETPNVDSFYRIFNIPPVTTLKQIINAVKSPQTYQQAYDVLDKLLANGYDANDILGIFADTIARSEDLHLSVRIAYLRAIANCRIKTELIQTNSHLFGLIANLGEYSQHGYSQEFR